MSYDLKDEGRILRAGVINKSLSQRFISVRRLMRDLETIDDHYDRGQDTGSIKTLLMKLLDTNSNTGDRVTQDISDYKEIFSNIQKRLDVLEGSGQ